MTQIKEGLSKADPKPMLIRMVEESNLSTDKKPSPELFSLIKAAATNLLGFGELWGSIKKKGHDEGFSEKELQDMLRPFLKEKVAELEDALRKTEQFKPANKLTEEQAKDMVMEVVKQTGLAVPLPNVDSILDWLKKSADGSHSFYYDTYGIDLFKNRELSQLKNSGVKVFKRLYFEV
jgi:hypothetical protein